MANKQLRYVHAEQRMKERYGMNLSLEEYDLLCQKTQIDGVIIGIKSKNRFRVVIQWKNRNVLIGWNKKTKLINTIMYLSKKDEKKYKNIIANQ